jgi:hypothetical protein
MAKQMKAAFEPLADLFLPALLKVCTRANKVFVTRAQSTLRNIVDASGSPRMMSRFTDGLSSPNKTLRACCIAFLEMLVKNAECSSLADHCNELEAAMRLGMGDADASVRETSRRIFHTYRMLFPDKAQQYVIFICACINHPQVSRDSSGKCHKILEGFRGKSNQIGRRKTTNV